MSFQVRKIFPKIFQPSVFRCENVSFREGLFLTPGQRPSRERPKFHGAPVTKLHHSRATGGRRSCSRSCVTYAPGGAQGSSLVWKSPGGQTPTGCLNFQSGRSKKGFAFLSFDNFLGLGVMAL